MIWYLLPEKFMKYINKILCLISLAGIFLMIFLFFCLLTSCPFIIGAVKPSESNVYSYFTWFDNLSYTFNIVNGGVFKHTNLISILIYAKYNHHLCKYNQNTPKMTLRTFHEHIYSPKNFNFDYHRGRILLKVRERWREKRRRRDSQSSWCATRNIFH